MTEFEKKVLRVTLCIPFGQLRTYRWVAQKAGRPRAYRAAANALKKNPYPVIIPCHRVIKSCGDIGGYSRGCEEKRKLIKLEKEAVSMLKYPNKNKAGSLRSRKYHKEGMA